MTRSTEKYYKARPFKPGELIVGRFSVIRLLHANDNGGVYLVNQTELPSSNNRMVVKIIQISTSDNLELTEARFKNEIFATYNVNHPNVIRSYEYFQEGDYIGFSMEYLPGGDLADLLQMGEPLPVVQIVDLLRQILPGLYAIHKAGIIHRDLKPENILFTQNGEIKISDFGTVRIGATLSKDGGISGTLRYLSPEYLRDGSLDPRSDIYSLGILAYEVATGKAPFKGSTPHSALEERTSKALTAPHVLRKDFPKGLSAFIMKALAKDPGDRFQNAAEMLDTLELVVKDPRCGVQLPGAKETDDLLYPSSNELPVLSAANFEEVESLEEEKVEDEVNIVEEEIVKESIVNTAAEEELSTAEGLIGDDDELFEDVLSSGRRRTGRELAATVQLQRKTNEDGSEVTIEESLEIAEEQLSASDNAKPIIDEIDPNQRSNKKLAKTVEIEQITTPLSAPKKRKSMRYPDRPISAIALRSAVVSGILGLCLTGILTITKDTSIQHAKSALKVEQEENTAEQIKEEMSSQQDEIASLASSLESEEFDQKRATLIVRANKQLTKIDSSLNKLKQKKLEQQKRKIEKKKAEQERKLAAQEKVVWSVLYLKARQQIEVANALQRLRGLGLNASVREQSDSEFRYLVQLGPFSKKEKAEILLERLRNSVLNNKYLEVIESE